MVVTSIDATAWKWWASRDEETYTVGPCDTREAVIAEGRSDFGSRPFFIVEATKPDPTQLIPPAASFISRVLEDAADDGQFGEDGDYDMRGPDDVIKTAFAELDAHLTGWAAKWKHLLPVPWQFNGTRNAEVIEGATLCDICDEPLEEGELCLTDVDLGPVHASCCGPERSSYVNLETGKPIGPDEPIPAPWKWGTSQ